LAGGLLAGSAERASIGRRSKEDVKEAFKEHRGRLKEYAALCDELGEQPADVALGWLLHNPAVTAPIIGPRTKAQLEGSLRALKMRLTRETLNRLDKIWPGPGGTAPEAYAW
jgi:aryl-alcohol dehydrogenase-like predicted oxidoreductase